MQASSRWTPPRGTLGGIVAEAEARAALLETRRAELEQAAALSAAAPSLEQVLRTASVEIIAEVKRKSPSKGAIAESLDSVAQARAYEAGGAAAVSILTEPLHFGGSDDDLRRVRAALGIPALKKDFHVAPIQLLEARALGASAALLIARAVSPALLESLTTYARKIGLEVLVEVRDEDELDRATSCGATMIGVNNRNLETLVIEEGTAERLIPLIPPTAVAIGESGVRSRADVEQLAAVGAEAVLIGSVLSAAPDAVTATRLLTGVARRPRVG